MPPRKRWMRQPLSWQRGGAVALAVLVVVMVAALVLDSGGTAELDPVVQALEQRGREPADLVERMGRAARVVLLSDVPGQRAPKRLAAQSVRTLAAGPGLDAVVLDVPAEEQPYIDAYLNRSVEDATVLMSRPRAVREHEGLARDYLEIYRAVREINEGVGAARRIRVIAAGLPDWPPPEGAAPEEVARLYSLRAQHMLRRMDEEVFSLMPEARVLVFVDGYLTQKRTRGLLRFGGGEAVEVEWLGELLRRRAPADTRTILLEVAAGRGGAVQRIPNYHGTELYRPLRRELSETAAVQVGEAFGVIRNPVLEFSSPGLRLEILPRGYTLREVADGYVFYGGS